MNYDNYDYLVQTVFTRFGIEGDFDAMLEEKMKAKPRPEVIELPCERELRSPLTNQVEGKAEAKFILELNEEKDRYFLNAVDVSVIDNTSGERVEQRFNLFNQTGLDIDQMINVTQGRYAHREYQRWDKELGRSITESGWFFRDENRLDDNGNPIVRVLNDKHTKFDVLAELSKLPLSLTQKQKNELIHDLQKGNQVYRSIPMPDGTKEKAALVLHPQRGIHAYDQKGERMRFKKNDEGKLVYMGTYGKETVSETTSKLIDKIKAIDGELGEGLEGGKGKGKGRKTA